MTNKVSIFFDDLYTFSSPKPILIFFQSTMNCARIPLLDQKCDSEKKYFLTKELLTMPSCVSGFIPSLMIWSFDQV